jgi:hypothetical protein
MLAASPAIGRLVANVPVAVARRRADRRRPVALGQAVEDDAVRRLYAAEDAIGVKAKSRRRNTERGIVCDDEIAGDDRSAARIGIRAAQRFRKIVIVAELLPNPAAQAEANPFRHVRRAGSPDDRPYPPYG